MKPGYFISLEGGEGAGKTTQIEYLKAAIEAAGVEVVTTREPGGSAVGEAIRHLLLDRALPAMHPDTELLMMFAARAEHVHRVIKPALAAGRWVISSRFTDASFVYQGAGRGVAPERLQALADWTLEGFQPDLTFVLDLPVDTGMARVLARGAVDRFEAESVAFFERVREGYLRRVEAEPHRVKRIDATESVARVTENIMEHLRAWLSPTT
ncbi:MAG: dTMP kinase [Thiotrichales bacterium]